MGYILFFGHTTICLLIHLLMNVGLFPVFSYYEQSCSEHLCASLWVRKYPRVDLLGHVVNTSTLNFIGNQQLIF